MNRREFTRGLASLGLTPALPVPAIGAGSTGAVAAKATADSMYFMGWYTAKLNKSCSPDMLASELSLDTDVAREIFAKLVRNKTVSAPDVFGISRTVNPLTDSYKHVTRKGAERVLSDSPDPLRVNKVMSSERSEHDNEESQPDVTLMESGPLPQPEIVEEITELDDETRLI